MSEKVNTADTDENLFRLVPVTGHSTLVLPLELVPMPGHGAQICDGAPTKGYVQTGARARGTKSEWGLIIIITRFIWFSCLPSRLVEKI